MAKNSNPFLELAVEAGELWNDRKELDYSNSKHAEKIIDKLEKRIEKIKQISFTEEFKLLKELHVRKQPK